MGADELSLGSWKTKDANEENRIVEEGVLALRAGLSVKLAGQTCQRPAVGNVGWKFCFAG